MQRLTDLLSDEDKRTITELLIEKVADYHREYTFRSQGDGLPDYAITDRMRDMARLWASVGRHCYPDDRVTFAYGLYDVGSHLCISHEHIAAMRHSYADKCDWYLICQPTYIEYGTGKPIVHPWQAEPVSYDEAVRYMEYHGAVALTAA